MTTEKKPPHINVDYFEDLTGDIPGPARETEPGIGDRIRRIRREKSLSLQALAEVTGFEVEFLSRIEEGAVQPQLGTLIKLSKALDSAFGSLVFGAGDRLYAVTRRGDRKEVSRSTTRTGKKRAYVYESLAPEVQGRHMEALIVELEENPEDAPSVHEGEEFIHVLEGTVRLGLGSEEFLLEPGDSVYYLSTLPHLIAARSGTARILAVLYQG